jgi:integration host factor subunit alpha
MTLTKERLIENIYNNCGYSKDGSIKLVELLVEIVKSTLESGEDVLLSGFGKFCVKEKNERRGRNPHTGDHLILRSRRVVTFQCSAVLKDKINEKYQDLT